MCAAGLKDQKTHAYLNKAIGHQMRDRREISDLCNAIVSIHVPTEGGRAHPARLWTWEFAS
eukprot:12916086-Prorocentrum_lima.AAC.1